MTVTVLLAEAAGVPYLERLDGVRPVLIDPAQPVPGDARDAAVVVVGTEDEAQVGARLRELPGLRLLQTLSAGYDRWLGVAPAGVAISNNRGAHGRVTAEWAATALLSVFRGFPVMAAAQAAGRWEPHRGRSLEGAEVLVLGAGDLAGHLRAMLEPFGARTTLVGRTARDGVRASADLPDLLPAADAVVLMLPLSDETRGMVDRAFLGRLRDGAVLVNAGRGPLVRTEDLLSELRSGRLRAALDVTDPEPLPAGHPLWSAPNVLITPHVGGFTDTVDERSWTVAGRQIAAFAAGRRPENLVRGDLP